MENIQHKNILSLKFWGYFSLIVTEKKKKITGDLQIKIYGDTFTSNSNLIHQISDFFSTKFKEIFNVSPTFFQPKLKFIENLSIESFDSNL